MTRRFPPFHSSHLRRCWLAALLGLALLAALLGEAAGAAPLLALAGALLLAALLFAVREARHLRSTFRAHDLAMREAHDGLWSWYPQSKELNVGQRLLALLGYSDNFIPNTHVWLQLVHPDDREHYNRTVAQHLKGLTPHFYCEYRVRARSGEYRWLASRGMALRNRRGIAYLMAGSVSDITERKANEEHIRNLAHHDQLTGLANRLLLADRLPQALLHGQRAAQSVAVLFLDLDRFMEINNSLGHAVGDELLVAIAGRLRQSVRESDTIVRQGGDEFIIILPGIENAMAVSLIATKILETIFAPVTVGSGRELCVSGSIGVAIFPDDGTEPDVLLRNADMAMYDAKGAGGNAFRFYTRLMNESMQRRVSIEAGLRHAIARQQLQLYIQPQVCLRSNDIVGGEVLLRWCDDQGRFISPAEFIPVAEDTGLIIPIGSWVIDQTIALIQAWRRARLAPPRLAINVSPRQLRIPGFAADLLARLAAAGMHPSAIEVEVTESIFLHSEDGSLDQLRQLAAAGVQIALDDFGTGYSSLSYLRKLPLDTLKIDRSFIMAIDPDRDSSSNAIVGAVGAMARALGMQVVAEGVEQAAQLEQLRGLQCDVFQGYLCSRPLPADEFARRFIGQRGACAGHGGGNGGGGVNGARGGTVADLPEAS